MKQACLEVLENRTAKLEMRSVSGQSRSVRERIALEMDFKFLFDEQAKALLDRLSAGSEQLRQLVLRSARFGIAAGVVHGDCEG